MKIREFSAGKLDHQEVLTMLSCVMPADGV
jgi:hypothetical protein